MSVDCDILLNLNNKTYFVKKVLQLQIKYVSIPKAKMNPIENRLSPWLPLGMDALQHAARLLI